MFGDKGHWGKKPPPNQPWAEAWLWHELLVYATECVALTPSLKKLGRWCHGLDFWTSASLSLHITPVLHFHSAIALSATEESCPHPKTSRERWCLCSTRVKLQFWLQPCIPSHLHAGYARGEPRHTVSQLILLMGYLKQTLIALKSQQPSVANSG